MLQKSFDAHEVVFPMIWKGILCKTAVGTPYSHLQVTSLSTGTGSLGPGVEDTTRSEGPIASQIPSTVERVLQKSWIHGSSVKSPTITSQKSPYARPLPGIRVLPFQHSSHNRPKLTSISNYSERSSSTAMLHTHFLLHSFTLIFTLRRPRCHQSRDQLSKLC